MNPDEILARATDSMTVRRVFAEPVERDGVTVIGVAEIRGGAGAGGGGEGSGSDRRDGLGIGFGVAAKPVGAFVIREGCVHWRPAVDVNRTIAVAGGIIAAALLVGFGIATTAIRACADE